MSGESALALTIAFSAAAPLFMTAGMSIGLELIQALWPWNVPDEPTAGCERGRRVAKDFFRRFGRAVQCWFNRFQG